MKKSILFISFIGFTVFNLAGQCPPDITFNTQAEVDAFPSDYPGCSAMPGNVIISGDEIKNLLGLSGLTSIGGSFQVSYNDSLTNLAGMEGVDSIGEYFTINQAHALTSLAGMDNLVFVGQSAFIGYTDVLPTLSGLNNLQHIGGHLGIENNDNLTNITALSNLQYLGDYLEIRYNPRLKHLLGLDNLDAIPGYLEIRENDSLLNVAALANVQSIGGEVTIHTNKALTSLAGLENVQSIGGKLWIWYNDSLENLGLVSLQSINGELWLRENGSLPSLAGLQNLETLAGNFNLQDNYSLQALADFEHLNFIGGDLDLQYNYDLTSLAGLENLQAVGGGLRFRYASLTDISALGNLQSIGGGFEIYLTSLSSLAGLEHLDTIPGDVEFSTSYGFPDFTGLNNLTYIGGDLTIFQVGAVSLAGLENLAYIDGNFSFGYNHELTGMEGMENLAHVDGDLFIINNSTLTSLVALGLLYIGGDLEIQDNDVLMVCSIPAVCNLLADPPGTIEIEGNFTGCQNQQQVYDACAVSYSQAMGAVFADLNCDALFNAGDVWMDNHLIRKGNNQVPVTATDATGNYQVLLLPFYTNVIKADPVSGYSVFPVDRTIITDQGILLYPDQDFRLCPDSVFLNFGVTLTPFNPPSPGFTNQYQVCIENFGTFAEDATLTFDFSGAAGGDYVTITGAAGGLIDGPSVTWNLEDIPLFTPQCFTVTVEISPVTPLEAVLFPQAQVEAGNGASETTLADNTVSFNQNVVGSFDPNDKIVFQPEVDFEEAENGARLEYLIRFQNTGTAPATFVEVLDTLEENLDISTFQMIAASHPYTVSFPADTILKWRFDNINLPDSASNEPESHGFVHFSIKTVPGLSLTDVVSNTASIYFDFNAPVITNTATTSFFVGVKEVTARDKLQLKAVPNPSTGLTMLQCALSEPSDCRIEVCSMQGAAVRSVNAGYLSEGLQFIPLDLTGFPSGVYCVRLVSRAGTGIVQVLIQ